MPAKIIITPGTEYSNLVVLREVDRIPTGKEFKRAVEVMCACGTIFVVRYNALKTGNTTSCGCSSKYVTPENRHTHLEELLKVKSFKRVDNFPITDGTQKISLYCKDCENIFLRDYNSLVNKGYNCPCCVKVDKKAKDKASVYLNKLLNCLSKTTQTYVGTVTDEVLKSNSDVYLNCNDCNNTIPRRLDVVVRTGIGCPCQTKYGYNPTEPSSLYLAELRDFDNSVIGYKYGIAKDVDKRHRIISRGFKGSIVKWFVWDYLDGITAQKHESIFKKSLPSLLTKTDMQDGWTETFHRELLTTFLLIQNNQYREVYY